MNYGLSMECNMRMCLKCRICNEDMDTHARGCPEGIIKEIIEKHRVIKCPVCRRTKVEINAGDFYECRACRTQFSRSHICGPNAAEELEETYLFPDSGEVLKVLIMKEKGEGKFPFDRYLKKFRQLRNRAMKVIDQRKKRQLEREKAKEARLKKLFEEVKKQMTGNWQV